MKLLILSNSEWDDSNSFGSSYSSIFGKMKDIEIANIYCREGIPNTETASSFFQITEKMMIKNLLNSSESVGKVIKQSFNKYDSLSDSEKRLYSFTKKKRWSLFIWIREFIWLIGRWKSKELIKFVKNYDPDIIFLPIYYSVYLNKIGVYLSELTQKPIVGYISDDCYTLRQFSFDPFFWLERIVKRVWVKKAIKKSEILYVISEIQKRDYDKIFQIESKLLFKGNNFQISPKFKPKKISFPIKLVYTGNIGDNRWRVLNSIGEAIHSINGVDSKLQLYIYSKSQISDNIINRLNKEQSVFFMGGVDANEISPILNNADILVHIEPMDLKGRLLVRQSFSTKIVDYLHAGRAIFAVGWKEAASIDYLVQNDAALVAFDEKSISEQLQKIVDNPEILSEYAQKAWECGKRNHRIEEIQTRLYDDLSQLIRE